MYNGTYSNWRGNVSVDERPTMLMLNGGVWNSMEPIADPEFEQLGAAIDTLLRLVQEEFPDVTLVWAGMTSLHVHRAKCENARDLHSWRERVKYMI